MDAMAAIVLVKDPKLRKGLEWFAEHAGLFVSYSVGARINNSR